MFANILYAETLDSLLQEYEDTSNNSLQTVNEKLGHVLVYSQKELRVMQHNTLADVLKELPLLNLNKNRFGLSTPSLAGTKTTVSGFFRLFLNDHEVSSIHTQSFALSWGEMPLDFVDYIEVYYGESSFALGNETGIYFVRVYTKSPDKENATQYKTIYSDNDSFSQSLTHSESFESGWSYLFFLNQNRVKDETRYQNELLKNNKISRYLYLDVNKDTTNINIGYNDTKKDNYMGMSLDVVPNSGEAESKDYFIDVSKEFLHDNSLKIGASYNIYTRQYNEKNDEGLWLVPIIDLTNTANTIPKEFSEKLKFTKTTAYINKKINYNKHQLLTSFHVKNKTQKLIDRKTVNFANQVTLNEKFNDFDEENIYSFILEDNYRLNNDVVLIANLKLDRYDRNAHLEDSNEKMHKVGIIYTPFKNFGLKSFYTKTYLPPSFYNTDFASSRNQDMKTQMYKFYTAEAVVTSDKAKFGVTYHNVKIDDFIYFTPIGFENIDHQIKTEGIIFDYKYNFSKNSQIAINYFTTKSSESINNSDNGGYIKYMGGFSKVEYFASLIYRNSYEYTPSTSNNVYVPNSYNLNLGATYHYTKDVSISIKGENLLDKSTESLFTDGFPATNFSSPDSDRTVSISLKLVF